MEPPEDIFSFDFFEDEPEPAPAGRLRRVARRAGPPLGQPPPLAPLLRLLALVFVVLFLVLVFALLVASCAGQSVHAADAAYMAQVNTLAEQSTSDGASTVAALTTSAAGVPQMVSKLDRIASAEQQDVVAAERLSPPGRLRAENADLVEALQLRVLGVQGLARELAAARASKSATSAEASALSAQASQLLASDVVWDDLFRQPSVAELTREGIGGVNVPESHFLANPDLIATPAAMTLVVQRLNTQQSSSSGSCPGLHGTSLVSVEALTSGAGSKPQQLHTGGLNTVTTSSSLLFRVTIFDGGNFQEVQIPVNLTIGRPQSQGGPITRTQTVQLIDPGQDASVDFGDLGQVPFASQTTLDVNVARVCGETNIANNSAQYSVIFSLPG